MPLPSPAMAALSAVRRFGGRYGLIAVLAALPIIYAVKDLTSGYTTFTVGHTVVHHNLSELGQNLVQGVSNGAPGGLGVKFIGGGRW